MQLYSQKLVKAPRIDWKTGKTCVFKIQSVCKTLFT